MPQWNAYTTEDWPYALWRWITRNGATDPSAIGPNPSGLTRIQIVPVINTSIYASGDELGTLQSITGAARVAGGGGTLKSVTLVDNTQAQRAPIDILFFNQSITVAGNNAPFLPSDGDMANCVGIVQIATANYVTAWAGTPTNSLATVPLYTSAAAATLDMPYTCAATTLFALAVVRATPTYVAATDLVFSYVFRPD